MFLTDIVCCQFTHTHTHSGHCITHTLSLTHTHTHTHKYIHTHIYTHTYIHIHTHIHVHIHAHTLSACSRLSCGGNGSGHIGCLIGLFVNPQEMRGVSQVSSITMY